jgi:hypothetical protein
MIITLGHGPLQKQTNTSLNIILQSVFLDAT